jgi:hypothetical protein
MTRSNETRGRRRFLKWAAVSAAALPAAGSLLRSRPAVASETKHLNEADPAAKALGYTADTTKVDPAKFPQHKSTQDCGGCRYYQGKAGSEWAPCTLFAGKGAVHSKGWCAAYAAR